MKKTISIAAIGLLILSGCRENTAKVAFETVGSMELKYAQQFSVDYCENGCSVVDINGDKFLVVPENIAVPQNTDGMTVIKQPVENIYMATSSAMDLFDSIGKLDNVKMTSTAENGWSLPEIASALEQGDIRYIGKYNSPDYETLVSEKSGLAIESTMIYHSPEVKEQLESFGIPVLVERSSYAHTLLHL